MRSVHDIQIFHNIPILVRSALNVPIENGEVVNDYRLRKAAGTLEFLSRHGARVIVISHIGEAGTETLAPVARALKRIVDNVSFLPETIGARARDAIRTLSPGQILVLENLRRTKGEVYNDPTFAGELASLADAFVEDSFDTCHRPHASIVSVPRLLPSYAGLLLEEEVRELSSALTPQHPALAVIGGAKFSTKEPVLNALLDSYDHVFVGGALANDFLQAAGKKVGASLVSGADPEKIKPLLSHPKIVLPVDALVLPKEAVGAMDARARARIATVDDVRPDELMLDHGPATSALLADLAKKTKTILWNGPLGNYEKGFVDATDAFARAIAHSQARSVVGGGDTVASIENLGLMPHFSFVSTGGGAMLEFLAKGSLPGISALDKRGAL